MTRKVYKDGVLVHDNFPLSIISPDASHFGIYTFVVSSEDCGSDSAQSGLFKQGQLFNKLHISCTLGYCIVQST